MNKNRFKKGTYKKESANRNITREVMKNASRREVCLGVWYWWWAPDPWQTSSSIPPGKDKHVSCSTKNNRACLQTMKTTYWWRIKKRVYGGYIIVLRLYGSAMSCYTHRKNTIVKAKLLAYHLLRHHLYNTRTPFCNVIDIWSGSCSSCPVIAVMQRIRF